jgi:hypothetical protein
MVTSKTKRRLFIAILNGLVVENTSSMVVVLPDEAQKLLTDDGFLFRVLREWLRDSSELPKRVAVFAGTASALANFYTNTESDRSSREPTSEYAEKGKALFPPFFELHTCGLRMKYLTQMQLDIDGLCSRCWLLMVKMAWNLPKKKLF